MKAPKPREAPVNRANAAAADDDVAVVTVAAVVVATVAAAVVAAANPARDHRGCRCFARSKIFARSDRTAFSYHHSP